MLREKNPHVNHLSVEKVAFVRIVPRMRGENLSKFIGFQYRYIYSSGR
jgi:hypothetical protein